MKVSFVFAKPLFFLLLTAFILTQCSRVPHTGRRQLALLPDSELNALSVTAYNDFLKQHKVVENSQDARLVKDVASKIAAAAEQYMRDNGLAHRLEGYKWEFNLIEDPTPNAWAMPGGKIVVYSGILPYTKTRDGLAVVLGHEIAHVIARHGNERMSQALLIQLGGVALSVALAEKPEETQQIFLAAYGVGSEVGISLPFSRAHEYEADRLGLIFMAMAGYNPNAAVEFWERMMTIPGERPPEYLSTHPSDKKRIANIKKIMPEAMRYYRP